MPRLIVEKSRVPAKPVSESAPTGSIFAALRAEIGGKPDIVVADEEDMVSLGGIVRELERRKDLILKGDVFRVAVVLSKEEFVAIRMLLARVKDKPQ